MPAAETPLNLLAPYDAALRVAANLSLARPYPDIDLL
jgi:hypothetical protein